MATIAVPQRKNGAISRREARGILDSVSFKGMGWRHAVPIDLYLIVINYVVLLRVISSIAQHPVHELTSVAGASEARIAPRNVGPGKM